MTLKQFDNIVGYLIDLTLPPNVSKDDPVSPAQLLAVLERHCEFLRGEVFKHTDPRALTADQLDREL